MNKPSIGRIVHVNTFNGARAAIITNVWNDVCVDLHIFYTKNDLTYSSPLEADVTSAMEGAYAGQWFWPPRA